MKILIVDDDVFSVTLMSDILSPLGRCDTAKNGDEAFKLFENAISEGSPYNLICLDIIMPGMDGHQVLKQIRFVEDCMGTATRESVKIIMITSDSDVDTILSSYNGGCDVYMTKPIARELIMDKIRYLGLIT